MKNKVTLPKFSRGNLMFFHSLIALSLLTASDVLAQSPPKDLLNSVIPPSPNAAALGKYGEVPVSLYTGIANINIPIYELKGNELSVPVSLSYHPSGIRVDEESSWVGLGWVLNGGGVITRSVVGVNDDHKDYGYLHTPAIPAKLLDFSAITAPQEVTANNDFLYYATINHLDPEPDIYYYNFNGYSGKFVFDANGVPQTIPSSNLQIEVNPLESPLLNFTITTPDGIKYKFGGTGKIEESTPVYIKYDDFYNYSTQSKFPEKFKSAWYLSEIQSPNGETIFFTYLAESVTTESNFSQTRFVDFNSNLLSQFSSNSTVKTIINGVRLSTISLNNGSIEFYSNKIRQDLNSTSAMALEKIIIRQNGAILSNFVLTTSYFQSTGTGAEYLKKRLKLNSVQEFSANLSTSKPPYVFTYDETAMSPRNTFSQDHWGYYNGKINNKNLIPAVFDKQRDMTKTANIYDKDTKQFIMENANTNTYIPVDYKNKVITFDGADREPKFPEMRALTLTGITYPTGGYTKFTYEPHTYKLPKPVYVAGKYTATAFANNVQTPPLIQEVTTTVNLATAITNNTLSSLYAKVHIGFSALQNMEELKFCQPKAQIYLKDVTSNEVLINFSGIGLAPEPIVYGAAGIDYATVKIGNGWDIYDVVVNPTHTYTLYASMYPCSNLTEPIQHSGIQMDVDYYTPVVRTYNGDAGGLRISSIETGGNTSAPSIKKYVYKAFGETKDISSGEIAQLPVYMQLNETTSSAVLATTPDRKRVSFFKASADNNLFNTTVIYTPVLSLSSGSRYVLGQTAGSPVGYKEVQEWSCDDINSTTASGGKVIHRYTGFDSNPDEKPTLFGLAFRGGLNQFLVKADPMSLNPTLQYIPFATPTSYDYKRGLITDELYVNSTDVIVKKIMYVYNPVTETNNLKIINAIKAVDLTYRSDGSNDMTYAKYTYRAAWNYLSYKTETTYDQNGSNGHVVATYYEYGNPLHMQPTAIATIFENANASNQRASYTKQYFAPDYTYTGTLSGSAAALKAMSDKHIWNTPVEQLNYNLKGSASNLVNGALTTFKMNGTSVVKDKDYSVKCNGSTIYQDIIPVTPASINSSGQFIYDAHYEPLNSYNKYDASNNLVELTDRHNTSSLIREPGTGYVWAKILNSTYGGIAYSSFEHTSPSAFTNWNYNVAGITTASSQNGVKAFTLTGNPINTVQTLASTQKYKVSFWRKVSGGATFSVKASGVTVSLRTGPQRNGWQYYEGIFTGATTVQITGDATIDELRLYPQNAQMVSYIYKDGVGVTSQCNENNQYTFWEYDEFNRLKLTKDQDGNILKKNEYQYQYIQN
jgi:hypothetical protein